MKVSSRVTRKWSQVPLALPSDSARSFTKYTVSKTEQLVRHIVAFREELLEVSNMVQDLERLLDQQLNFIKMKNQVET